MKTRTCIFDGILFDMDGVLVDSEPIHYRAEDQIFKKMGISLSEEMRRSFTGLSNDLMWETIRKHLSITRPVADMKREAEEMRLDYFSNLAENYILDIEKYTTRLMQKIRRL